MPKVRTSRDVPPAGWEKIEETIQDFERRMRDAENEPRDTKRKVETTWPIMRIHHERSRFLYEMFYKKKEISRELYDWCIRMGYGDANLIAKWKKTGYERLCCLQCIMSQDHNYNKTCICRVPKKNLEEGRVVECVHCGCHGCASCD
eukprot:m51a1_g10950 putative protein bud31 homolog (147) ;mRNA; r:199025-199630